MNDGGKPNMQVGTGPRLKLATLVDVREITEGEPVELWLSAAGRLVVRAFNECGNNYTEVDVFSLLDWARDSSGKVFANEPKVLAAL